MQATSQKAILIFAKKFPNTWHSLPDFGRGNARRVRNAARKLAANGKIWLSEYDNGSAQFKAR